MVLSSLAVGYGLTMAGKLRKGSAVDRLASHEALSLAVMLAIAVHGLALLGDQYLHPTWLDITVPFAASYKQLPTALGIVAGWGFIVLGLSYYLRKHIGAKRWKLIHRFTIVAWAGGIVHALTEGTDAGLWWFIALVLLSTLPVLVLLVLRVSRARGRSPLQRGYARGHARATPPPTSRPIALDVVRGRYPRPQAPDPARGG
jgi:methionine sulfoxide reductase heme-binding subunit